MLRILEPEPTRFSCWFQSGFTRREQRVLLTPELIGRNGLIRFLESGRSFSDIGYHLRESAGFLISGWNGRSDPDYANFVGIVGRGVEAGLGTNFFSVTTSQPLGVAAPVPDLSALQAVLLALIEAWTPAYAVIRPPNLVRPRAVGSEFGPRYLGGWIVYISESLARLITAPEGLEHRVAGDGGLFMTATPGPFDSENPVHVEAANAIHAALEPIQHLPYP